MPGIVVVANPVAGRGHGAAARDAAVARLRELGVEPQVHSGRSAADTRTLVARAISEQPDVIVLVGGDGTLTTVLGELAGSRIPLALVPAGTGNDFARALGIPVGSAEAAAAAAELAVRGAPQYIDIGEVDCPDGSAAFLTVAALGFDAKVSERTNRLRRPRGPLRYYLALIIELIRLRPLRYVLSVDGALLPATDGTLVAVCNTRSYGGGMLICPDADPHDGLLDVVHVAPIGRLKLLRVFPKLLRGTHIGLPQVTTTRGSEVRVSAPDLIVYADGERVGTGSATLRTAPGALTIMLPANP